MPRVTPKEFTLGEIEVENQDTRARRLTVAVENYDEVVFLETVTATPGEWDGDDIVRQGGVGIDEPVSGLGHYVVHVRLETGPIRTLRAAEVVADGGCVGVVPNIERDGSFHWEYHYCSGN